MAKILPLPFDFKLIPQNQNANHLIIAPYNISAPLDKFLKNFAKRLPVKDFDFCYISHTFDDIYETHCFPTGCVSLKLSEKNHERHFLAFEKHLPQNQCQIIYSPIFPSFSFMKACCWLGKPWYIYIHKDTLCDDNFEYFMEENFNNYQLEPKDVTYDFLIACESGYGWGGLYYL